MSHHSLGENDSYRQEIQLVESENVWREKYAEIHRLTRIVEFPLGVTPPKKVRIYRRREHFLLQWWDRAEKKTLSQRVDGDLVEAISKARWVDDRLVCLLGSGRRSKCIGHFDLVKCFVLDLDKRADAGEIDVATAGRYKAALEYYLRFVAQPKVAKQYPRPDRIDREFRLGFDTFLNQIQVSSNGHRNTEPRPMRGQSFVIDVIRGMFQWSVDPDRGKLLPEGFRNPFTGRKKRTDQVAHDPIRNFDITMTMALDLINSSDHFQLTIFTPLLLYGLRPGELGWLFHEHRDNLWMHVKCLTELGYMTKGRRNKQFPYLSVVPRLGGQKETSNEFGLIHVNRRVFEGLVKPPLWGQSLAFLKSEFGRRCKAQSMTSAIQRRCIRDSLMQEAGQLNYDHVSAEFRTLARELNWPPNATLKDLRHLFSTCLENAGVPEFFRKYFMGQSFGRAPLVTYTHLTSDMIEQHFMKALTTELHPLVDAIESRVQKLGHGNA